MLAAFPIHRCSCPGSPCHAQSPRPRRGGLTTPRAARTSAGRPEATLTTLTPALVLPATDSAGISPWPGRLLALPELNFLRERLCAEPLNSATGRSLFARAVGLSVNGSRLCKAGASYAGMDRVQAERRVCARMDRRGRRRGRCGEGDWKCLSGLSEQERQGHLGNVHHGRQSAAAVKNAAHPSSARAARFHRLAEGCAWPQPGSSRRRRTRMHEHGGRQIQKYILDYATRPTCALLHRNKHANA